MKLLDRYIFKSLIGPFIFALSVVIFVFLFQFLIKSLDQLVGKGLGIWLIIQLISLNLAWMVTLAVPMAILVSSLMTFGTLSSQNELTIIKSSGVSLQRMMFPLIIFSILMFYLMIRFNNDVLPEANHKARVLLYDISKTKPTFILEPGMFSDDLQGVQILVKKTFPNSNLIEGVYIYDYSNPISKNILTAKNGDISFTSDFKKVVLNLNNGEIHQLNIKDEKSGYRKVRFEKHMLTFDSEGFGFSSSDENTFIRGDRELSADAMNRIVDSLELSKGSVYYKILEKNAGDIKKLFKINFIDTVFKKTFVANIDSIQITGQIGRKTVHTTEYDSLLSYIRLFVNKKSEIRNNESLKKQIEKQIDTYNVEIYKKYSIPFACIVFALVGAPLGYRVRKGGFGIAAGLSLLFFLLYWACLIGGEKLADRTIISPFLSMWIANILLGSFGLYLMYKSS